MIYKHSVLARRVSYPMGNCSQDDCPMGICPVTTVVFFYYYLFLYKYQPQQIICIQKDVQVHCQCKLKLVRKIDVCLDKYRDLNI